MIVMSELVDLVDKSGQIVEIGIERSLAEQRVDLLIQNVVLVILNSAGEVLWHRRHPAKRFEGNKIDHVCGALISGEDPEDAAKREAIEEVGLQLEDIELVDERVNPYGYYRRLYLGYSDESPVVDYAKQEVIEAGFVHPGEIATRFAAEELVKDFLADLSLAGVEIK